MAGRKLLRNCFTERKHGGEALLLPETLRISFEKASRIPENLDILFYGSPYGLIPLGLRYSYPFSQTNYPRILLDECLDELVEESMKQLKAAGYGKVLIISAKSKALERLGKEIAKRLKELEIKVEEVRDIRELVREKG